MTIIQAAILGMVQGLTEFLPISSSGHLVLFQHWFGLKEEMLVFDIAVHWGTLLAVIIYFFSDIKKITFQTVQFILCRPKGAESDAFFNENPYALSSGLIILSSVVTVLVGIFFREVFEFAFRTVFAVGIAWLIMGTLLIYADRMKSLEPERDLAHMHHRDAFFIGLAQGLALIPGVSRSGSTILMGIRCGLNRKEAARYSFLLGIPAILGVGLLKLNEGLPVMLAQPAVYVTGFACSMAVGFLTIIALFKVLERGKFHFFGYYCLAIGLFAMASQFLKS